MAVTVASRRIDRLYALSHRARLVLGLVDDGLHWTEWAIADPRVHYHFRDEASFVAAVHAGLHASFLLFLRNLGLTVSPDVLMALPTADVRALVQAEHAQPSSAAEVRLDRICERLGLVTAQGFERARAFLDSLGVEKKALFQAMGLRDWLAIIALDDEREPLAFEYHKDAVAFADHHGTTVLEFVDYFSIYLDVVARADLTGRPARERREAADDTVAVLRSLLFRALDCPRVEPGAQDEVPSAIEEWQAMGRGIGFLRLSQGMHQLIAHSRLCEKPLHEAPYIVAEHLAGAQALLMSGDLERVALTQDGRALFRTASAQHEAIVTLGTDGLITLTAYKQLLLETLKQMETNDG